MLANRASRPKLRIDGTTPLRRRDAAVISGELINDFVVEFRRAAGNAGYNKLEVHEMVKSFWDFNEKVNLKAATARFKEIMQRAEEEKTVDEVAFDAAAKMLRFVFFKGEVMQAASIAWQLDIGDWVAHEKHEAYLLNLEVGREGIASRLRDFEVGVSQRDSAGDRAVMVIDRSEGRTSANGIELRN